MSSASEWSERAHSESTARRQRQSPKMIRSDCNANELLRAFGRQQFSAYCWRRRKLRVGSLCLALAALRSGHVQAHMLRRAAPKAPGSLLTSASSGCCRCRSQRQRQGRTRSKRPRFARRWGEPCAANFASDVVARGAPRRLTLCRAAAGRASEQAAEQAGAGGARSQREQPSGERRNAVVESSSVPQQRDSQPDSRSSV